MTRSSEPGVSLRKLTAASLREITGLRVAPEQADSVATNAESIAEAFFHPEAWFRGIYAGETPVGFVMLEDKRLLPEPVAAPIGLWRLMIDQRYQGLGYGRKALQLVVAHIRSRSDQDCLLSSFVPGPHGPIDFYLRCGFELTGELDGNEVVIRLPFNTSSTL